MTPEDIAAAAKHGIECGRYYWTSRHRGNVAHWPVRVYVHDLGKHPKTGVPIAWVLGFYGRSTTIQQSVHLEQLFAKKSDMWKHLAAIAKRRVTHFRKQLKTDERLLATYTRRANAQAQKEKQNGR